MPEDKPQKVNLAFRIAKTLRDQFKGIVGMQGKSAEEVLTEFVRTYVAEYWRKLGRKPPKE